MCSSKNTIVSSLHITGTGKGDPPRMGDIVQVKYSISYYEGNKLRVLPKGQSETMWLGRPGMPKGLEAGLLHLKAGQNGTWDCDPEGGFEREVELDDGGERFKIPAKSKLQFDVDLEKVTLGAASN